MLAAIRVRVGARRPAVCRRRVARRQRAPQLAGPRGCRRDASLSAAAAVSAPIDLTAAGIAIGRGLNLIYTWYFLATLKPKGARAGAALSRACWTSAPRRASARCTTSTRPSPRRCTASRAPTDYWKRRLEQAVACRHRRAHARAQRNQRSVHPRRFAAGPGRGQPQRAARAAGARRPRGIRRRSVPRPAHVDAAAAAAVLSHRPVASAGRGRRTRWIRPPMLGYAPAHRCARASRRVPSP